MLQALTIVARRHADKFREFFGEGRVVVEANLKGDLGHGKLRFHEEFAGFEYS